MRHLTSTLRNAGIMLFLALFSFSTLFAQLAPQSGGFSYQAVARDNTGSPLESQALTVRISIHESNADGARVWQEDHDVTTTEFGLFTLVVGGQDAYAATGMVEVFSDIDWSATQYFMNVQVKKDNEFLDMGGSPIQTVPVAQYAQKAKSAAGNFAIQAERDETGGEALFEVKRSDGSIAFAVYEDMVWVYAKEDTKGMKGGFAVGGYNSAKAGQAEYMRITPDSVRVYINEANVKGKKGGFAVGGYNAATKGLGDQYMYVSGNDPLNDDYTIGLGVKANASGPYSTAIGYQSEASGINAQAFGNGAKALALNATSIGYQSEANGQQSIAIGSYYNYSFSLLPYFDYGKKDDSKGDFIIWEPIITPIFRTISFNRANIAEGRYSVSLGNGNWSKDGGMALGSNNDALGFGSVTLGVSNKAINTSAFAAGYNSKADGYYATAIGNNASAKAYGSFVIGQYNLIAGDSTKWVSTDPLFVVGNGLNDANRNNALTIYKNGRSVFMGADANLTLNDRRLRFFYDITSGTFRTDLEVYGVRSYVNRIDPAVDTYYSGFFFDTGTEGVYRGFYADIRSGDGADIAEYIYDTDGNTTPGDVLVADPNNKESVLISKGPYQTSVIGVVSTEPHLTMNMQLVIDEETGASMEGVKATRLALTGRVPCKVTDENGSIQPGDLLTTSSTPGHAMKWSPVDVNQAQDFEALKSMLAENETRSHAVIGKALETHNSGTGKIMMLISLQ